MHSHCSECGRVFVDENGEPTELRDTTICVECFINQGFLGGVVG